jgi:hypothetical protein
MERSANSEKSYRRLDMESKVRDDGVLVTEGLDEKDCWTIANALAANRLPELWYGEAGNPSDAADLAAQAELYGRISRLIIDFLGAHRQLRKPEVR